MWRLACQPAFTFTVVVMNSAMPGLTATGSGTGPPGVGCIAGAVTRNSAGKGVPLMRIAWPFLDFSVFGLEQAMAQGLIDPAAIVMSLEANVPAEEEALDLCGLGTGQGAPAETEAPAADDSQPASENPDEGLFSGFGIEEAIKRGLIDPKSLGMTRRGTDRGQS